MNEDKSFSGFILGAGFSKSISDYMPDMKGLHSAVIEILENRGDLHCSSLARRLENALGNDLESYLTYLSNDEPWLPESSVLRNRADFLEISFAIRDAIWNAQRNSEALGSDDLNWIRDFIWTCMKHRVVMASLNYDLLVEKLIREKNGNYTDYYTVDFQQLPGEEDWYEDPGIAALTSRPRMRNTLFKFNKLHGSLNWYHAGSGGEIFDGGLDDKNFRHEDKSPLIVPPAFSKLSYFQNPKIKAMWRSTYTFMRRCSNIYVVGYSLPVADISMRTMLGNIFNEDYVKNIYVVDIDSNMKNWYLGKFPGAKAKMKFDFLGPNAVRKMAEVFCREHPIPESGNPWNRF